MHEAARPSWSHEVMKPWQDDSRGPQCFRLHFGRGRYFCWWDSWPTPLFDSIPWSRWGWSLSGNSVFYELLHFAVSFFCCFAAFFLLLLLELDGWVVVFGDRKGFGIGFSRRYLWDFGAIACSKVRMYLVALFFLLLVLFFFSFLFLFLLLLLLMMMMMMVMLMMMMMMMMMMMVFQWASEGLWFEQQLERFPSSYLLQSRSESQLSGKALLFLGTNEGRKASFLECVLRVRYRLNSNNTLWIHPFYCLPFRSPWKSLWSRSQWSWWSRGHVQRWVMALVYSLDVVLLSRCGEPGSVFDQHKILWMIYHITISMHIMSDVSQNGRP